LAGGTFDAPSSAQVPPTLSTGGSAPGEPVTDEFPPFGGEAPPGSEFQPPLTDPPTPTSRKALRARSKSSRRRRLLIEWVIVLAIAAIIAVLLRAFVVQAFFVPSASMEPTLQEGDRILVVKSSLLTGSITRGDIIVFQHPNDFNCGDDDNIQDLVKRVIGLPGETIWSRGDTIYINGKPLSDPGWYRPGLPQVGALPIAKQTIPSGDYFVMGDNRTDSCDSRSFGPIAGSSVIGQVVAIVWRNGHPYLHFF
jgi:signal peptidase I